MADPTGVWQAPDDVRRPLIDARASLKAAEDSCLDVIVEAFRRMLSTAPPQARADCISWLGVGLRADGKAAEADRLVAAFAACQAAFLAVLAAEDALQQALPTTIDLPSLSPHEE